jgi:hypothetical protein
MIVALVLKKAEKWQKIAKIMILTMTSGTDVMILIYFRRKNRQKIGVFDSQQS